MVCVCVDTQVLLSFFLFPRYATFAALGGSTWPTRDDKAAAAHLPPVDSVDLSSVLMSTAVDPPRPRTTFLVGTEPAQTNFSNAPLCSSYRGLHEAQMYDEHGRAAARQVRLAPKGARCTTVTGVIHDDGNGKLWKLMTGDEKQYVQTGPAYPNSTTGDFNSQDAQWTRSCGDGCLFELYADPAERHDLAALASSRAILKQLREVVTAAIPTAYNPDRGKVDPRACAAARNKWGGFWGPFVDP
jgi:hypothetical protein